MIPRQSDRQSRTGDLTQLERAVESGSFGTIRAIHATHTRRTTGTWNSACRDSDAVQTPNNRYRRTIWIEKTNARRQSPGSSIVNIDRIESLEASLRAEFVVQSPETMPAARSGCNDSAGCGCGDVREKWNDSETVGWAPPTSHSQTDEWPLVGRAHPTCLRVDLPANTHADEVWL